MSKIELVTTVNAPIEICFDLSRSIDLHVITQGKSGEKAVAGVTSGLIGLNDTVTWEARHFGIKQRLTSKISVCDRPNIFVDELVKGAFRSIYHQHIFRQEGDATIITDIFEYESPLGIFGKLANMLVLDRYLTNLLKERNAIIKEYAESGKWREVIGH